MTDQLRIEKQLCFPIYLFAKEIINYYRPLLKDLELTYPQYLVMMVLWENKKSTVNEIGERLSLDSGTLTPLLKRLEKKGFVERQRSEKDERVVEISLTHCGSNLKKAAEKIPEQLIDIMKVNQEDLETLKHLIHKVLRNKNANELGDY